MAGIKNTVALIRKSIGHIDSRYDLLARNVEDIYNMSCNGFRFGYMQGMKAAKAEMKKGGICA